MTEQINLDSLWKKIWDTISRLTDAPEDKSKEWLTAAIIRIWAGNRLYSDTYLRAINQFSNRKYTKAQLTEALETAGNDTKSLCVPQFFRDIVRTDAMHGTSISRNLAETLSTILVQFASINGDFTIEEANALQEITDSLTGYCDGMKIKPYDFQVWNQEMVTPINPDSYSGAGSSQSFHTDNAASDIFSSLKNTDISDISPVEKSTVVSGFANIFDDFFGSSAPAASGSKKNSCMPSAGSIVSPDMFVDKAAAQTNPQAKETVPEETDTLESVMEELNSLVGLDQVKKDVQSLMNFINICQLREKKGMKVPSVSYHLVFTGNPGTGKTTVARLIAKLYKLMGILPQGQLIETDRSGLVAGYLGQTAIKTQEVIQQAMGGVLFIDEAYSLANDSQDSYGKEAIETILKAMEDNRDKLVVIVAGYDNLMHKFIDSNPGLRSRFNKYFHFPDYDGQALLKIMQRYCDKNGYTIEENALNFLTGKFNEIFENRSEHFGNARYVRNLFESAIHFQADRLSKKDTPTDEELSILDQDDITAAIEANSSI